jgi:hypothetical protein
VANLSGFGTGGPMEQRKAYDMLIQAEAGLISVTGTPQTPVKTGLPAADIASGMYCSPAHILLPAAFPHGNDQAAERWRAPVRGEAQPRRCIPRPGHAADAVVCRR